MIEVTDVNFQDEVLGSDIPVLVDFWANWCGPCKQLSPVIDEISREYKGRVKVGKCDIDVNQGVPSNYGIMSIPCLMLFQNGDVIDQISGSTSKAVIKKMIADSMNACAV